MSLTNKAEVNLFDDGLLWFINVSLFHPRGFALACDRATGQFELWGNGDEPWCYAPEVDQDTKFLAVEAAFDKVRNHGDSEVPTPET